MKLLPHQQQILDINPHRTALFWSTGVGKSFSAISLVEKNAKTVLIICPKLLKPMWLRETKTHGSKCIYTVYTKEEFKKLASSLDSFDACIIDEFHFWGGFSSSGKASQLHRETYKYLKRHDIKYRYFLTATPYLSHPFNIFALARLLGHDWNFWGFRKKFYIDIRMGHRTIPKARVDQKAKQELAKLTHSIGHVMDLEGAIALANDSIETYDILLPDKLPDSTYITEYFELTQSQKEGIKALDDADFIARWTKTHAIENGILYSDGYTEDKEFPCNKTYHIKKLCLLHPKIVILARYNAQLEYLSRVIAELIPDTTLIIINGQTKDRDALITKANTLDNCVLLLQASCSTGFQLPTFPVMVFASMSFSHVDHVQAIGRIQRIDKLKENTYIYLVSNGVDRDVYNSIMDKRDFSFEIYRTT